MMYKTGTLADYLLENPEPIDEDSPSQCRRWKNPLVEDQYLWCSETGIITEAEKFNIVATWTGSIIKPKSRKYYIIGSKIAGIVEPGEAMESGSTTLEIFNRKTDWQARAKVLGIDLTVLLDS